MQGNVSHGAKDFLYSRGMRIDRWVAAARAALGWSQDQLAESVNKTRANVSHWENGKHEPSLETIKLIGRLSGLDPRALFDDDATDVVRLPEAARDRNWPFSFDYALFDRLPPQQKAEANLILRGYIAQFEDRAEKRGSGTR